MRGRLDINRRDAAADRGQCDCWRGVGSIGPVIIAPGHRFPAIRYKCLW
jgi:hypothetical protein